MRNRKAHFTFFGIVSTFVLAQPASPQEWRFPAGERARAELEAQEAEWEAERAAELEERLRGSQPDPEDPEDASEDARARCYFGVSDC